MPAAPPTEQLLRRLYEAWYTPDRATLIVVGEVDPAWLEGQIATRFGDWRARAGEANDIAVTGSRIAGDDRLARVPLLDRDVDFGEFRRHFAPIFGRQQRGFGRVVAEDAQAAHRVSFLNSSSQPSRNSKASRCRRASAMSRPQAYKPWPSIR